MQKLVRVVRESTTEEVNEIPSATTNAGAPRGTRARQEMRRWPSSTLPGSQIEQPSDHQEQGNEKMEGESIGRGACPGSEPASQHPPKHHSGTGQHVESADIQPEPGPSPTAGKPTEAEQPTKATAKPKASPAPAAARTHPQATSEACLECASGNPSRTRDEDLSKASVIDSPSKEPPRTESPLCSYFQPREFVPFGV